MADSDKTVRSFPHLELYPGHQINCVLVLMIACSQHLSAVGVDTHAHARSLGQLCSARRMYPLWASTTSFWQNQTCYGSIWSWKMIIQQSLTQVSTAKTTKYPCLLSESFWDAVCNVFSRCTKFNWSRAWRERLPFIWIWTICPQCNFSSSSFVEAKHLAVNHSVKVFAEMIHCCVWCDTSWRAAV